MTTAPSRRHIAAGANALLFALLGSTAFSACEWGLSASPHNDGSPDSKPPLKIAQFDASVDGGRTSRLEAGEVVDAPSISPSEAGTLPDVSSVGRIDTGDETEGAAVLTVSPTSVSFGTVSAGMQHYATVVVANSGSAASGMLVITSSSGLGVSGCAGTLQPHGACQLSISPSSWSPGSISGEVRIAADPGADPPLRIYVSGEIVLDD